MENNMNSAAKIISFLLSLCLTIMGYTDNGGKVNYGAFEYIGSNYYTGTDSFSSAQGITNDGEYLYCTGSVTPLFFTGLTKIDIQTGEIIAKNEKAMPTELSRQTFNHLGGVSYYDGKLYAAIEDAGRKHPCIGVFSAETLEFTGQYKILEEDIQPKGNLPWCAADKDKGVLYTGISRGCTFVNVLDINTLEFIERIELDASLYKTQGAEVYDGKIYISCNDTTSEKHIYAVDIETGTTEVVMERTTGTSIVESEGITIYETEDGVFFRQIDVLYPFGMAIREYKMK